MLFKPLENRLVAGATKLIHVPTVLKEMEHHGAMVTVNGMTQPEFAFQRVSQRPVMISIIMGSIPYTTGKK